ncbi:MAG: alpha-(1-_3)-arabinofuranosyltransferase family protein, partial [Acidimicrobiia bacterium]|nr:alpha-(1->3)-arabinofuranosyltransferase family protein [Acidimicrobiia bacterium]
MTRAVTTRTVATTGPGGAGRSTARWIPVLAGYRALAALAVLVFHILSLDEPTGVLGRWTIPLGNAAVTVFFVLSGFLIYRPFVAWAFGDGPAVDWWRFMLRRAARILPLYWAVLTVYLFVVKWGTVYTTGELVTAYLLVQNFRGAMVFIPPFVAWSLCIELWFSFALPAIAAPLRWLGAWRPRAHRFTVQLVGLALLALAGVVFRQWAVGTSADSGRLLWMPAYLDWFAAGLVLAVMAHHWSVAGPPPWVRQLADNPWVFGTVALTAYWTVTQLGLPGGFVAPTPFQTHLQFALQAIAGMAVIATATVPDSRLNRVPGLLSAPPLTRIGAYGYGIYLIHSLIIDVIVDRWPEINRLILTAVVLVATIAVSALAHHLVERPASRLTDRFLGRRRSKPLAAGLRQWSDGGPAPLLNDAAAPPGSIPVGAAALAGNGPLTVPSSDTVVIGLAGHRDRWWPNRHDSAGNNPDGEQLGPGFTVVDTPLVDDDNRSPQPAESPITELVNTEPVNTEPVNTEPVSTRPPSTELVNTASRAEQNGGPVQPPAPDLVDLLSLATSTRRLSGYGELPRPGTAWVAHDRAFQALASTREISKPTHHRRTTDPVKEMLNILTRPLTMALGLALVSLATTVLAAPGRYVADARFEVFTDPVARLRRMFALWDPHRDLGRVAEEFWPAVTLFATTLRSIGLEPWLVQRLWHALLLTLAATGALALSRTLRPDLGWPALVVAVLYGFGPFSAIYLIPSTLYLNHALAPWLVVAVLRATRGNHPLAWAGATTLALVAVGNADPPGLVFAGVPAAMTWIGLAVTTWTKRPARLGLWLYTGVTVCTTVLASAAMLAKTSTGASALALRLVETESVETVAATTSFAETARGMGLWLNLFRLGPVELRSHQLMFVNDPWSVAATFVPLLAAVGSLIWWRGRPQRLALAWLVAGTILAVGPHPVDDPSPHGELLLRLYESSNVAFGFRSTHKAGTIIALGVALLGGWALACLAAWPARRLRSLRRAPLLLVAVILAVLTQPFWRTPLYDPQFQSEGVAPHWQELGAWFEANPPDGRVLVVPGSTNNGYRWGRIGDDLLDPLVPNRVVASTLPLSTLPGADVIRELDLTLTSPDYRAGTLLPLARELGISTVIVRNDLDWQLQGLAPPNALDGLRADPDLQLRRTFGSPGRGGAPTNLAPIEVYEVAELGPGRAGPTVVSGDRTTIVVDGSTRAVLDMASLGLLDQQPVIRFGPELDQGELERLADDVALVVLGDSLVAEQRRVNHYGYYQVPAALAADTDAQGDGGGGSGPNHWLPDFDARSFVHPFTPAARVSSDIDRWLLTTGQPSAASDGDPGSGWMVPLLVESEAPTWTVEFDDEQPAGLVDIDVIDQGDRLGWVKVRADGRSLPPSSIESGLRIEIERPYRRLDVTLPVERRGPDPVGISEVRFDGAPLVSAAELSPRLPELIAETAAPELEGIPLLIRLGPATPSPSPWQRTISLWRTDRFELAAEVVTAGKPVNRACLGDLVTVNGQPWPVRLIPTGAEGPQGSATAQLESCVDGVELAAGVHRVEVTPGRFEIGTFRLLSESPTTAWADRGPGPGLGPIERTPVTMGQTLVGGSTVVTPYSFDQRWRARVGGQSLDPIMVGGLTGFMVPDGGGRLESFDFQPDPMFTTALYLSAVGVALALLAVVTGLSQPRLRLRSRSRRRQRWWSDRRRRPDADVPEIAVAPVDVGGTPGPWVRRRHRIVWALWWLPALGAVYWFIGPWGVIGAVVAAGVLALSWTAAVGAIGLTVLAAAVVTTWPTLSGADVDPTRADGIGRLMIAGLTALLVAWPSADRPAVT